MAEIKILVRGDRILIRENIDRNGPALVFALADKAAIIAGINAVSNPGDVAVRNGVFARQTDFTANPIAVFSSKVDADAFLATKGGNFINNEQIDTVDGFAWVIQRKPGV